MSSSPRFRAASRALELRAAGAGQIEGMTAPILRGPAPFGQPFGLELVDRRDQPARIQAQHLADLLLGGAVGEVDHEDAHLTIS
jgi:hypothetical protein